jgi:hypothetical protein
MGNKIYAILISGRCSLFGIISDVFWVNTGAMDGLRAKSSSDSFWKKNLKNVPGRFVIARGILKFEAIGSIAGQVRRRKCPRLSLRRVQHHFRTFRIASKMPGTLKMTKSLRNSQARKSSFTLWCPKFHPSSTAFNQLKCPLYVDGKISKRVAHSAALNVINSHRSETREAAKEATISQERKADSLQRLAIQKGDNPLGIEPVVSPTSRHFPGHPQQLVSKKGLQISMAEGEGCPPKFKNSPVLLNNFSLNSNRQW